MGTPVSAEPIRFRKSPRDERGLFICDLLFVIGDCPCLRLRSRDQVMSWRVIMTSVVSGCDSPRARGV